jgi:lipid-binding SYLF domain-containing protein
MNLIRLAAATTAALITVVGAQATSPKVEKRLEQASVVLNEMMGASDKGVPQDLLSQAQCVVVIPGLKKAGFIVGAKYGQGFAVCRKAGGRGWSAPGAVRIEGGSFGLQIGASETDVILVVKNESGMHKLLEDKFTLGAGAEATAGPVGRDLSAQTDVQMRAEILSYSRSRGVFAGLTLNGATLRPDKDDNTDLYGHEVTQKEILSGEVPPPPAAAPLEHALDKYSMRKG